MVLPDIFTDGRTAVDTYVQRTDVGTGDRPNLSSGGRQPSHAEVGSFGRPVDVTSLIHLPLFGRSFLYPSYVGRRRQPSPVSLVVRPLGATRRQPTERTVSGRWANCFRQSASGHNPPQPDSKQNRAGSVLVADRSGLERYLQHQHRQQQLLLLPPMASGPSS
jgi:hypothetical protein